MQPKPWRQDHTKLPRKELCQNLSGNPSIQNLGMLGCQFSLWGPEGRHQPYRHSRASPSRIIIQATHKIRSFPPKTSIPSCGVISKAVNQAITKPPGNSAYCEENHLLRECFSCSWLEKKPAWTKEDVWLDVFFPREKVTLVGLERTLQRSRVRSKQSSPTTSGIKKDICIKAQEDKTSSCSHATWSQAFYSLTEEKDLSGGISCIMYWQLMLVCLTLALKIGNSLFKLSW